MIAVARLKKFVPPPRLEDEHHGDAVVVYIDGVSGGRRTSVDRDDQGVA